MADRLPALSRDVLDPSGPVSALSSRRRLTPVSVKGKKRGAPRGRGQRLPTPRPPREPKSSLKKRSSLFKLPLELIERIFMSAPAQLMGFPRCHPLIGYWLSRRLILVELLITAFGPTWEIWFGCISTEVVSYHGHADDYAKRFGGDPTFQSAVLRCRWVRLDLMLAAQELWYERDQRKGSPPRHFRHLYEDSGSPHDPEGGCFDHHLSSRKCFEWDWTGFRSHTCQINMNIYDFDWHPNRRAHMDVHPYTELPEFLFCEPFDWEKAMWLFWLVKGGARLSWANNWETTYRGFRSILQLDNDELRDELMHIFYKLGVFSVHWPMEEFSRALRLCYMIFSAKPNPGVHKAFVLVSRSRVGPLLPAYGGKRTRGGKLPIGSGLDREGRPTRDMSAALDGGIVLPIDPPIGYEFSCVGNWPYWYGDTGRP